MVLQHLQKLANKQIILASSSPRRKEILDKLVGLNIMVVPSKFEENLDPQNFKHPSEFVIATAQGKAKEVAKRLSGSASLPHPDLVIGADTCISFENQVYGKPRDHQDAHLTLSKLSGRNHEVLTGVCLMIWDGKLWIETTFSECTKVKFGQLSKEEITAYINTGEPMDKAGGYGIQGLGGTLVEGITGDYYNVVGFPLHRFCHHLSRIIADTLPLGEEA
ncbi:hypothetical protein Pcinc_009556 [Petrolisthes cinctipes]|uniref:Uncharacterized protein n=1 Tax=Petrolisthes cinctipes TaxID=88211 RepID=A0AAE1KVF4_PETCI|nr:hypothetical protein Pcinc_009556 [Petrolisthes cinctipes]